MNTVERERERASPIELYSSLEYGRLYSMRLAKVYLILYAMIATPRLRVPLRSENAIRADLLLRRGSGTVSGSAFVIRHAVVARLRESMSSHQWEMRKVESKK